MSIASSQGTTVFWGGRAIGRLRSAKASQSVGSVFDCTAIASPLVGSGENTRVVEQLNPVSISPAVVSLEMFGSAPFSRDDIGLIKVLTIRTRSGSLSGRAYLQEFAKDVVVGEKITSTAIFKFTGF